jgi:hypothetical protein
MDERAVLAGPVDADAARHPLEHPGGGAPSPGIRAEARETPVAHDPARVEDGAPVSLAVGVPALGVVWAAGERLVEDEPLAVGRVELGGRVVDPETGAPPEHAADVEGGVPLLVGPPAARCRKEPHARPPACAGAVRHGFAEVGHMPRMRQEAPVPAAKQPDLERVEADGAPPRGAGALVQDDHPGEASPSRFATNTLKPACGSSPPAKAPMCPNAGLPVRRKWRKARGFEPCSCPKAQS